MQLEDNHRLRRCVITWATTRSTWLGWLMTLIRWLTALRDAAKKYANGK
jgi:hypothetical protein